MKKIFALLLSLVGANLLAITESPLNCLIQQSECILEGEVQGRLSWVCTEASTSSSQFKVKITKVLKGANLSPGETVFIHAKIDQEVAENIQPEEKKVFFLRRASFEVRIRLQEKMKQFQTADFWFGILPSSYPLTRTIEEHEESGK